MIWFDTLWYGMAWLAMIRFSYVHVVAGEGDFLRPYSTTLEQYAGTFKKHYIHEKLPLVMVWCVVQ